MEMKVAKVFDSALRVVDLVVDLKIKRSTLCEPYVTGAARKVLLHGIPPNYSIDKCGNRRKLDGSKSKCGLSCRNRPKGCRSSPRNAIPRFSLGNASETRSQEEESRS